MHFLLRQTLVDSDLVVGVSDGATFLLIANTFEAQKRLLYLWTSSLTVSIVWNICKILLANNPMLDLQMTKTYSMGMTGLYRLTLFTMTRQYFSSAGTWSKIQDSNCQIRDGWGSLLGCPKPRHSRTSGWSPAWCRGRSCTSPSAAPLRSPSECQWFWDKPIAGWWRASPETRQKGRLA